MANKINPDRIPCEYILVYALSEGGLYEYRGDFSPEKYDDLLRDGYFHLHGSFDGEEVIYPAYAMLCKVEKGHDFRIDEINGDRTPFKPTEARSVRFRHKR